MAILQLNTSAARPSVLKAGHAHLPLNCITLLHVALHCYTLESTALELTTSAVCSRQGTRTCCSLWSRKTSVEAIAPLHDGQSKVQYSLHDLQSTQNYCSDRLQFYIKFCVSVCLCVCERMQAHMYLCVFGMLCCVIIIT